ncbi:MAG: hypothetical protein CMF75_01910 [Maricaulis sp.]|nr:hypothetical protein [Maricaulis sp.]
MSYAYRYDRDLGVFIIRFSGAVDMAEILKSDHELIHEPDWPGSRRILTRLDPEADLSALTVEQYLEVAMPYMEASQAQRGPGTREAWVVPERWNSPIIQVWQHLPMKDGLHEFAVFDEEADALAWLLAE